MSGSARDARGQLEGGGAGLLALLLALSLGACGGGEHARPRAAYRVRTAGGVPTASAVSNARVLTTTSTNTAVPSLPVVSPPGQLDRAWQAVLNIDGQSAAWAAQRGGVTLVRFDQRLVHLVLHAGTSEPEGEGWAHGSEISVQERPRVVAGFNGGFKLDSGSVGFVSDGRVAVPLTAGLASIVTYQDGTTDIGAWQVTVPARQRGAVASVLQNLHLLVDRGRSAAAVEDCGIECWGATLGGGIEVARSALGITAAGELVWAGGERISPAELADAMVGAGVQRAAELDINPEWVAGYLYVQHSGGPSAEPLVPGQTGIPGQLLTPDRRDFFTLLAN